MKNLELSNKIELINSLKGVLDYCRTTPNTEDIKKLTQIKLSKILETL